MLEIVKFQSWEHLFEPPIPVLHKNKVQMFYLNLTFSNDTLYLTSQVHDMDISLNEQVMTEALGVPTQETRSLKDECGSEKFLRYIGKLDDLNIKSMTKKSLTEEFQYLLNWLTSLSFFARKSALI